MGFSVAASQCLVAPPQVFGGIIIYINGWVGDKYRLRGPIIIFNSLICLIGLPVMGFHSSSAVRYFGVFLVTAGSGANVPRPCRTRPTTSAASGSARSQAPPLYRLVALAVLQAAWSSGVRTPQVIGRACMLAWHVRRCLSLLSPSLRSISAGSTGRQTEARRSSSATM